MLADLCLLLSKSAYPLQQLLLDLVTHGGCQKKNVDEYESDEGVDSEARAYPAHAE